MRTHRETQLLLYDYLRNVLPEEQASEVEKHIAVCDECQHDAEAIRAVLGPISRPDGSPSDRLPEAYWVAFANTVDARVRTGAGREGSRRRGRVSRWIEAIRWKPIAAGASALAVALLAFLLTQEPVAVPGRSPEPAVAAQAPVADTSAARVQQYLRKSKALLVGLTNLKVEDRAPVDFALERRMSRQLAEESRLLRREPLDPRGRRLVGDLEKIFIELANVPEDGPMPAVDMVRAGIEEENLLFKVRMAETAYGHARIIPAGMRR